MKILIKICLLVILVIGISSNIALAEEITTYTLLIYMNGSDLESDYSAGTSDILEMIEATIPDNVAVILETGGTNDWHSDEYGLPTIDASQVQRWRVTDSTITLLENVGIKSMVSTNTLSDFLDYGITNYPSDQYGLIMWNHGAGAVYGYGADEQFGYTSMSLNDIQTAFENSVLQSDKKLDFVGFDACLMSSVEVAHILEPYASYLVASEALEPGEGWDYTSLLNHINNYPDTSAENMGKAIVSGFFQHSKENGTQDTITLSAVDLSKIPSVIDAMDDFLEQLQIGLATTNRELILQARMQAESYGEGTTDFADSDMVDLIDYAKRLEYLYPSTVNNLIVAVEESVTDFINSHYKPNATGLSIYIPARDRDTMVIAKDRLDDINMSNIYERYIDSVANIIINNDYVIEVESETATVNIDEIDVDAIDISGDDSYFYIKLGREDLSAVSYIYSIMGKVDSEEDIQYLSRDLIGTEDISETGDVIGRTLDSWVKINGNYVALYYESHDDLGAITYSIPIDINDISADLIVIFSKNSPKGKIIGARPFNGSSENIQSRNLIELKAGDKIYFNYEYDVYNFIDDYYEYDGWYYHEYITVGDGLELDWVSLEIGDYAYCFEVVDIYGNSIYSDWLTYDYYATGDDGIVDAGIWDILEIKDLDTNENIVSDFPWVLEKGEMPSDWAVDHVNEAYKNDLLIDPVRENFREDITREIFCELVVNMYETVKGKSIAISNLNIFKDTNNIEIIKAYQLGIVNGYGDGYFKPDNRITREELITMFYRTLVLLDSSLDNYTYPVIEFDDKNQVANWAEMPTRLMVYHELINGIGNNLIAPKNRATIEQAVKLVNGVYKFYLNR